MFNMFKVYINMLDTISVYYITLQTYIPPEPLFNPKRVISFQNTGT